MSSTKPYDQGRYFFVPEPMLESLDFAIQYEEEEKTFHVGPVLFEKIQSEEVTQVKFVKLAATIKERTMQSIVDEMKANMSDEEVTKYFGGSADV